MAVKSLLFSAAKVTAALFHWGAREACLFDADAEGCPVQDGLEGGLDLVHDDHRDAAVQNAVRGSAGVAITCIGVDIVRPLTTKP